jgi:hypothetical protein
VLCAVPHAVRGPRKKLDEVARYWAGGDLISEEEHARQLAHLEEQFRLSGIVPDRPLDEIEPVLEVYLWPQNVQAWDLFMRVQTQWKVRVEAAGGGMGYRIESRRTGLDYEGVEIVMRRMRIPPRRRDERFCDVQVMEFAALEEWAKRAGA